jgi:hypothetical protein
MEKYICVNNFVIEQTGEVAFEKGKIYNGRIVKNIYLIKSKLGQHNLTPEFMVEHFKLVDKSENLPKNKWEHVWKVETEPTTQILNSNEDRLKYIDVGLRLANIQLHKELLEKVVKIVDLVDKKGGKANIEDIVKL